MSFAKKVGDFDKKFIKNSNETIKAATVEIFENIIDDSPEKTGNFVGNWHVGDQVYQETVSNRGTMISEMKSRIESITTIKDVQLVNNTPYGVFIEYGSSDEAPAGMLRVNEMKWDKTLERNGKPL